MGIHMGKKIKLDCYYTPYAMPRNQLQVDHRPKTEHETKEN